jgi:hypothetical protein
MCECLCSTNIYHKHTFDHKPPMKQYQTCYCTNLPYSSIRFHHFEIYISSLKSQAVQDRGIISSSRISPIYHRLCSYSLHHSPAVKLWPHKSEACRQPCADLSECVITPFPQTTPASLLFSSTMPRGAKPPTPGKLQILREARRACQKAGRVPSWTAAQI